MAMVDTVKLYTPYVVLPPMIPEFERNGLVWTLNNKGNDRYSYCSKLGNLNLNWCSYGLRITNSLHTFFQGDNSGFLSVKELKDSIRLLCECLSLKASEVQIKGFGYGVNYTNNGIWDYSTFAGYKGKQPSNMLKCSKPYGVKFYLSKYSIKGYDKSFEQLQHYGRVITSNTERVEVELKDLSSIKYKKLVLVDMMEPSIWDYLCVEFMKRYDAIEKNLSLDCMDLLPKELRLFYLQHDKAKEHMKREFNASFKQDQKSYRKLLKKQAPSESRSLILDKVELFKAGFTSL